MEGCKEKGVIVKVTGQENDFHSSTLNVYKQSKTASVKARNLDSAGFYSLTIGEAESLYESFSCVDGSEIPNLIHVMQKETSRFTGPT